MKCIVFIQQISGYGMLHTGEATMKEEEASLVLKQLTIRGIQISNYKYNMGGAYTWRANLS